MKHKIAGAAALMAITSTSALAQGFAGASVEGEFRNYYGDDRDSSSFSLDAGVDFTINSDIGFGGNFSTGRDDDRDVEYTNGTVHGYYAVTESAAFGLFVASDSADDLESTIYGVEFGGRTERSRYEFYFGRSDLENAAGEDDLRIFGASFEFGTSNGFAFGLHHESILGLVSTVVGTGAVVDDVTLGDTALVARYYVTPQASVYAKAGRIGSAARDDENDVTLLGNEDARYFGVGAEFALGERGGNLFGSRTLAGWGF